MSKELSSNIQHDLRREFHNMIGILKIINHDLIINDHELKSMLELCLERESEVSVKLDELSLLLETKND